MHRHFVSLLVFAIASCIPVLGMSQGEEVRDRVIKDYFGGRSEFRQPRSANHDRHPTALMRFRTISGEFNNLDKPTRGMAGVGLRRLTPVAYEDGTNSPSGASRPNARVISNMVNAQSGSIPNEYGLSSMFWQWGQFLDHDIDLTESADPPEPFFIDVPAGDPFFDPDYTGTQQIQLFRSIYRNRGPYRNQINEITSWVDGSNVYGSDDETAIALRTRSRGLMKQSEDGLLPVDDEGFFLAGDVRANEQHGLIAMHTLFVREHNRIAERIGRRRPHLNDEQIYQRARRRVIGILQAITYKEFLPALLGTDALGAYEGYQPEINPNIANVFSTTAYRFGHSMLNEELLRLNNDGTTIEAGNIMLRDAFFNPDEFRLHGVDPILKGLTAQPAQQLDTMVIDDVRNFLFGPPGSGGFDLASLNIQRGRDHGLPDLNRVRTAYGLPPHETFADLTNDVELQLALDATYGDINNVDPWVGMLAENHVPGATVGETAHAVILLQFRNLRDGDRFWYQRDLRGQELRSVERSTLRRVIARNTGVRQLQSNVFYVADD